MIEIREFFYMLYKPKHVNRIHQMPNVFYYRFPVALVEYLHSILDHDYAKKFPVLHTS